MARPVYKMIPRRCRVCRSRFMARRSDVMKGVGGFVCSPRCHGITASRGRAKVNTRPPADKAQMVRAHGLINMRLRRGTLKRPSRCSGCQMRRKVEAHHDDYNKPADIRWLCRSCHTKAHVRKK